MYILLSIDVSLRKHAYSNIYIVESFTSKNWKIPGTKDPDIYHISAQNIDCGYSLEPPHGGSNEYLNLCFWADIKKQCISL